MDEFRSSVNDLAQACACSGEAEWEELLRRSTPLVSLVVGRVSRAWMNGSSPAIVDDIVQEVFLKLCEQERRILRDFEPRGEDSFLGLLRIVSASVANDYFRRLYSAKRGGKVVTTPLAEDFTQGLADDARATAQIHKSVLLAQLDRKLQSAPAIISDRDRDLFWLYYLQGLTAEEIAVVPGCGLTPKGVESALRRVARWLRETVEARPKSGEPGPGEVPD
jgi:RNA polymerase sigma-70 factor (ECF subfamily)